jgi:hypothetical protein
MDRPFGLSGQRVAIVLIVLGLTLGIALTAASTGTIARTGFGHGSAPLTVPSASAAPSVGTALKPSAVHPAQAPTTVSAQVQTGVGTYTVLPFVMVLNLTVQNAPIIYWVNATGVPVTNAQLWLNISDFTTSTLCVSNDLSGMLTNASAPANSTSVTEYLTFPLTTAYFVNATVGCPNLGADPALLNFTAIINGGPNGTGSAQGVQFGQCNPFTTGYCVSPVTSVIFAPPTSLLQVATTPSQPNTFQLSANYSGQYVGKVQLSIFSPSTGAVVFSANLRSNGTTPTVATWTESSPGNYPYTLGVFTTYGTFNSTGSIAVAPPTSVFTNVTSWSNTTFIPGLSSGAAGSILLVVGLIVGMIVALAVGRLVWGGPKAEGPAQPWTQKPTEAGNVCSVCGRSFATPEELAEHSKTEHGMQ